MNNTFEWFVGTWTSDQRRLREVLVGSEDWYEFPGTNRSWSALDGACNFDRPCSPPKGSAG